DRAAKEDRSAASPPPRVASAPWLTAGGAGRAPGAKLSGMFSPSDLSRYDNRPLAHPRTLAGVFGLLGDRGHRRETQCTGDGVVETRRLAVCNDRPPHCRILCPAGPPRAAARAGPCSG